jgi:F0F1-type ATP synthase assembly protein I
VNLNPLGDVSSQEPDGLVLGLELVLATTIFGFLGFLLDGAIGTRPLIMFLLGGFTLGWEVWKIVAGYEARMAEHAEQRRPLRRGSDR